MILFCVIQQKEEEMKKIILGIAPLVLLSQMTFAQSCVALTGCAKKVCELESKLHSVSEVHAVARIQAAIDDAKANCTDESVAAHDTEHQNKHQVKVDKKIADAQEDLAEAKVKKQKAQAEGRADKVHKYQRKIEEKQQKIQHLQLER